MQQVDQSKFESLIRPSIGKVWNLCESERRATLLVLNETREDEPRELGFHKMSSENGHPSWHCSAQSQLSSQIDWHQEEGSRASNLCGPPYSCDSTPHRCNIVSRELRSGNFRKIRKGSPRELILSKKHKRILLRFQVLSQTWPKFRTLQATRSYKIVSWTQKFEANKIWQEVQSILFWLDWFVIGNAVWGAFTPFDFGGRSFDQSSEKRCTRLVRFKCLWNQEQQDTWWFAGNIYEPQLPPTFLFPRCNQTVLQTTEPSMRIKLSDHLQCKLTYVVHLCMLLWTSVVHLNSR